MMKNQINKIMLLISFSWFFSCKNQKVDSLCTSWVIDSMAVEGIKYNGNQLRGNLLYVDENGSCRLPSLFESRKRNAFWSINNSDEDDLNITITDAGEEFYNGEYQVKISDKNRYGIKYATFSSNDVIIWGVSEF